MEDITKEAGEETIAEASEQDTEPTDVIDERKVDPESAEAAPNDAESDAEPTDNALSPLEALMKNGLSEREAILVLDDREQRRLSRTDTPDSLPRMTHSPRLNISYGELMQMKEIFEDLSDTEINRLYNKVTK